ncbi:MAG: hypothetical protein Q8O03_01820 [Nanoarchaeota archaeon]|nr:hypothetical protein [Nanoarchaeota archaeon]
MDIDECYKKNLIKKTRVDSERIISLIEMSDIKKTTVKTADINEINISAYVSMAYSSLLEILESISLSKGYSVSSHLCLGELLREILEDFDYYQFDRMRYARNGIEYYGTKIEFKQGKELIEKMFDMREILMKKYLKEFLIKP